MVRRASVAAAVAVAVSFSCSRPIKRARTNYAQLPSAEENDAQARLRHKRCSPNLAFLFPGLGQHCTRKSGDAGLLAGLTIAEATAAIYASQKVEVAEGDSTLEHPAVFVPVAGIQDLYVYGIADTYIDRNLAAGQLYAPRDSLEDLAAAPFNIEVMKEPKVFLGILGMLAVGLGVTFAVSDIDTSEAGNDPNVFGESFSPAVGYGLSGAIFGGLFTHVAMAEEIMFRGVVQSSLARSQGELGGLIYGSLIFGAVHAPNALAFEGDDRRDYLIYALPTITAIGTYLSYLYKDGEYSLAAPTAVHFWYDFLLSATSVIVTPEDSLVSARLRWAF